LLQPSPRQRLSDSVHGEKALAAGFFDQAGALTVDAALSDELTVEETAAVEERTNEVVLLPVDVTGDTGSVAVGATRGAAAEVDLVAAILTANRARRVLTQRLERLVLRVFAPPSLQATEDSFFNFLAALRPAGIHDASLQVDHRLLTARKGDSTPDAVFVAAR